MVITVSCPACASSFPVDSNKIPEAGVSARCSSCGEIFRIERPQEQAPPPPAPEPEAVQPEPEPTFSEPEPAFSEPEPEAEAEPLPSFDTGSLEAEPLAADAPADRDVDAETDFSIGTEEPQAESPDVAEQSEDWVFETDAEIDPGSLDIEPVETVESHVDGARDESAFFGGPPAPAEAEVSDEPEPSFQAEPAPEMDAPAPEIAAPAPETGAPAAAFEEPVVEPVASAPEPEATEEASAEPAEEAPSVTGFTFGKRDPKEKARRLARVLVSDMIMYNPERHEKALANGTLKADFEEEIGKSWKEYIEQVGEEMATENPFWAEALNDVLAKGEQIF